MKILVAEDEPLMLMAIEAKLRKDGFEVTGTSDGREALKAFENDIPDLIITDILMPYASGFEIISKVKNRKEGKPIPVIIVSNAGNEDMVLEGFKLGADDFLKKPVMPGELLIRVKRLLMQYK